MSFNHSCPDIDFVFLQDLSGSFTDDLPILKSQIANVIATVEDVNPNADFAVASFIDKPTGSFGAATDYVYQTHLGISSDNAAVIDAVNSLSTRSGLDAPEAQLEGLMQAALRTDEIGYRPDTIRIVMLSTDAAYHVAGDFAGAPANNGDAILNGGGIGEDYPSVVQVAMALVDSGVFPIFAVTATQKPVYDALVASLGTGAVVVITSDSADFSDAVRLAVAKACGHVTQEGTELDDSLSGDSNDDGIYGIGGNDDLRGGGGSDIVDGGSGDDRCFGGNGDDDVLGGSGNDKLFGGAGDDVLSGGLGKDVMRGGAGFDIFIINPDDTKAIITDFENGIDKIDLSAYRKFEGVNAVNGAKQVGSNVKMVMPDGTVILLKNTTLADIDMTDFLINPANDGPSAVADSTTITSGHSRELNVLANDSDPNADAISVSAVGAPAHGTATVTASGTILYTSTAGYTGTDSFTYTITDGDLTSTTTVTVTVEPSLVGDNLANVIVGTAGADLLKGFGGNDTLSGMDGFDTILGGSGDDSIDGGLGNDSIKAGGGNDIIFGGPETDFGVADKDVIQGQGGNDQMFGGFGDDKMYGGTGLDTIVGGQGDDQIFGDRGNDSLDGGLDNDEIQGGTGNDIILGGDGNDQIWGDLGADTITGGAGNDQIYGSGGVGADDDVLTGGTGVDTFVFSMSFSENKTGSDRITDFDVTEDFIQLDGQVGVTLTDTVDGVVIENLGGDMILVEGVLAADIRPAITGLVEL